MKNNISQDEIQKYANDIKTIKDILIKVEEISIIESWVFYLCGIVTLAGTFLHYLLSYHWGFSTSSILLTIWLPLFCIFVIIESVGVIRKLSAESLPLFPRTVVKLYIGILGSTITSIFIIVILSQNGLQNTIPAVILTLWALFYFQYAQIDFSFLYIHGFIGIAAGILLYVIKIEVSLQYVITGSLGAISFLSAGYSANKIERKQNG